MSKDTQDRSGIKCRRPCRRQAPGVPCADVDKAAREVIERSGYGKYFTHRTGHGIGMEGHEDPYMRGDNMQLLEPGMAYTVEPGIYLTGRNGVRIEDNVVITETGAECLSDMPRDTRGWIIVEDK
ncbi:M24 family metallopeptidase [Candidatus Villigracilis saccharophilus]|uniref:M24 family metallopeptidase n=1 Tax=Candidatus Villigracilis saccharophilus TaxID=3140684 RepID=UPI0031ED22B0